MQSNRLVNIWFIGGRLTSNRFFNFCFNLKIKIFSFIVKWINIHKICSYHDIFFNIRKKRHLRYLELCLNMTFYLRKLYFHEFILSFCKQHTWKVCNAPDSILVRRNILFVFFDNNYFDKTSVLFISNLKMIYCSFQLR